MDDREPPLTEDEIAAIKQAKRLCFHPIGEYGYVKDRVRYP